ncbi:MAG: hypothetical protein NHB15_14105 [Methanosarcina barkeri]|nr:hypothetical protein [Methanosarcina sp. ERenArc_MAG2]
MPVADEKHKVTGENLLEIAKDLKLTHLLDRHSLTLSGVEKQRVALTRAPGDRS